MHIVRCHTTIGQSCHMATNWILEGFLLAKFFLAKNDLLASHKYRKFKEKFCDTIFPTLTNKGLKKLLTKFYNVFTTSLP